MKLKASLHIHTSEDRKDGHMISYDAYQLIDEAERCGFEVLGYTPHQKFVFKPEFAEYARKKGILLIPGVERNLGRLLHSHVIILNCGKSIEKVKNFKQLRKYKSEHPEVFIIAPHPTFNRLFSVGARNLKKNIDLFDAVEYSWMYSRKHNSNQEAETIARKFGKPVIATADVHVLKKLDTDFAYIDVDGYTPSAVFSAIRQGDFENITAPKRLADIIYYSTVTCLNYGYSWIAAKIFRHKVKKLIPVQVGGY